MSGPSKVDRQTTTPFLLKLFYKTGSFHRLDEFAPRQAPPPHLQIYTWPTCTLRELTSLLSSAMPALHLPAPTSGTRLAFRLVFADTRDPRPGPARFVAKDLGSVIVSPADSTDGDAAAANGDSQVHPDRRRNDDDAERTLDSARFVIGDYVDVAILPPLPDGSVAAPPPPAQMGGPPGGPPSGYWGRGEGGRGSRENGFGGRRGGGRFDGPPRGGGGVPHGEWRRGERLPEYGGGAGGSFGRGRGRRGAPY